MLVTDRATREALAELNKPAVRRYAAQSAAGEVALEPPERRPGPSAEEIAATEPPAYFLTPLLTAAVVVVVCVDLGMVAATDQDLDRVGLVSGASVYPLAWNMLLAARPGGVRRHVHDHGHRRGAAGQGAARHPGAVRRRGRGPARASRSSSRRKLRRQPVAEFVTWERFDGEPFAG